MRMPLIVLFASLTACASHDDAASEFQHSLDDTSAELSRHLSSCNAAATDARMSQELVRHDEAMQSLMSKMDTHFDQMGHCYRGDPALMKGLMSDVADAERAHHQRMIDAASLDEARVECQRYVTETDGELDEMRERFQQEGARCMMMMM